MTRRYAATVTQVVARLDDELIAAVDRLVKEGIFASRSDAIRRALHHTVDQQRRRRIGDAIVAGYRRIPETDEEIRWADAATIAMIEDEPW
jgi:Arc/MetJ-type ribon-helix-helix transcriptional regulator